MAKARVKHANPGWAKTLAKRLGSLAGKEIAAGFPRGHKGGAQTYDNGAGVLQAAAWNQFGTATSPARPFMDVAARQLENDARSEAAGIVRGVIRGESPAGALGQIARLAEGAVKEAITDGDYAPNAPSTVYKSLMRLKGYSKAAPGGKKRRRLEAGKKPLIDTGKMRQAAVAAVRDKREG